MFCSWYVSHLNIFSTGDSAVLVSLLSILEQRSADPEVTAAALRELDSKLDLNMKIYTVPWIVQTALRSENNRDAAVQILLGIAGKCRNSSWAGTLFRLIGQDEPLKNEAVRAASEMTEKKQDLPSYTKDDYLFLEKRLDIIALLSVAAEIGDETDQLSAVIEEAASGSNGRYAAVLAFRAAARRKMPLGIDLLKNMMRLEPRFYLFPDLIYACICFRYVDKSSDALLKDVLSRNQRLLNKMADEYKFFMDVRGKLWFCSSGTEEWSDYSLRRNFISRLWDSSALLFGLRRAEEEGRDRVFRFTVSCADRWNWLHCSPQAQNHSFYPWIPLCNHDTMQLTALNAVALTVPLLSKMIPSLPLPDDLPAYDSKSIMFLLEFTVNLAASFYTGDMKDGGRFRKKGDSLSADKYSKPLCVLLCFASILSESIIKGQLNPNIPQLYYALIRRRTLPILNHQPLRESISQHERALHQRFMLNVCVQAAYEEGSGDVPWIQSGRRWLSGESGSLAYHICQIAIENSGNTASGIGKIDKPAILAYEHFRDLLTDEHIDPKRLSDWMANMNAGNKPLTGEILCSLSQRRYTPYDWFHLPADLSKYLRQDPDDPNGVLYLSEQNVSSIIVALMIIRLIHIAAQRPQLQPDDVRLFEQYAAYISTLKEIIKLPRLWRYHIADLLRCILSDRIYGQFFIFRSGQENQIIAWKNVNAQDLARISEHTVLDLSREAVFYQYQIGKALIDSSLNMETSYRMLVRLFAAMLYYQCMTQTADAESSDLVPGYKQIEKQENRTNKMLLLQWFIGQICSDAGRRPMLDEIEEEFEDGGNGHESVLLRITADGIEAANGDPSLFSLREWDPDTLGAFLGRCSGRWMPYPAEKTESGAYVPLRRDFIRLMTECSVWDTEQLFVLIEADEDQVLVSGGTGRNYVLPENVWEEESWKNIITAAHDAEEQFDTSTGLYLYAKITLNAETGLPRLTLSTEKDMMQNLRYQHLFSEDDSILRTDIAADGSILRDGFRIQTEVLANEDEKEPFLSVAGWDEQRRRTGRLLVTKDRSVRSIRCQPGTERAVIEKYTGLDKGDVIQIKNFRFLKNPDPDCQFVEVLTPENVTMKMRIDCFPDHLLAAGSATRFKMDNGIYAVVESTAFKKSNPNGLIWSHKPADGDNLIEIRWLKPEEEAVQSITVPVSALGLPSQFSGSLKCGTPVIVDPSDPGRIRLAQDNPSYRNIVRLLWRLHLCNAPEMKVYGSQTYLGPYRFKEDDTQYLCADYEENTILCYRNDVDPAQKKTCGVDLKAGKVRNAELYSGNNSFDRVKFTQGRTVFYGKAPHGVFRAADTACSRVYITLTPYEFTGADGISRTRYDIQRIFDEPVTENNVNIRRHAAPATLSDRRAQKFFEEYQSWMSGREWIIDGKLHCDGTWIRETDAETGEEKLWFKPEKPLSRFPLKPDEVSDKDPADKWTDRIPMRLNNPSLLELCRDQRVFAVIRKDENGIFAAYPEESAELNLKRLRRVLNRKQPNTAVYSGTSALYCLGQADMNNIQHLEMYLGLRAAIPIQSLHIGSYRPGFLFYGDCISVYSFAVWQQAEIRLKYEGYIKRQLRQVEEFTRMEERALPADLDYDAVQGLRLEAREKLKKIRAARLTPETESFVREKLPEGGRGVLVVSGSDWNEGASCFFFSHLKISDLHGMTLCLAGQNIEETSTGNDYQLRLSPHPEMLRDEIMLDPEYAKYRFTVNRRSFSFHEGALRMHYRADQKDAFASDILVRIDDKQPREDKHDIACSLKMLPPHPDKQVISWLKLYGSHRVVFDEVRIRTEGDLAQYRCELLPGSFCLAWVEKRYRIDKGTPGFVCLRGDRICAQPIAQADRSYMTEGRTADLLVADGAWNRPYANFTAAGLPQVMINTKTQEFLNACCRSQPPHIGMITSDDKNVYAEPSDAPYGFMHVNTDPETHRKWLKLRVPKHPDADIPPQNLSFLDASYGELVDHIERGELHWHYHDKTTEYIRNGKVMQHTYHPPFPVIFTDQLSLRYPFTQIRRFAFPPHELEEYGFDGEYPLPVAYVDKKSMTIYAELAPGRIIAVTEQQLSFGSERELPNIDLLFTGDLLYLHTEDADHGTLKPIILDRVDYGIRSYFKGHAAFLPLLACEHGKTVLGSKTFKLILPTKQPVYKGRRGDVLMLGKDNMLSEIRSYPEQGDCVMIRPDADGNLKAAGFPDSTVHFHTDTIAFASLFRGITDREAQSGIFDALGDFLPVTVKSASEETKTLEVYYQQPAQLPPADKPISAQILGSLNGTEILLRAGTFLLTLKLDKELNVSAELAAEILRTAEDRGFLHSGGSVWVCRDKRSFHLCRNIAAAESPNYRRLELLFSVDSQAGSGILCFDRSNQAYFWMPLDQISHSEYATARDVFDILKQYSQNASDADADDSRVTTVAAKIRNDRQASWILGNVYLKINYERLAPNAANRKKIVTVIIDKEIPNPEAADKAHYYLCHESPYGNILTLISKETTREIGEGVKAVCTRYSYKNAEMTAESERRISLPLSRYLLTTAEEAFRFHQIERAKIHGAYTKSDGPKMNFENAYINGTVNETIYALYGRSYDLHQRSMDPESDIYKNHKAMIRDALQKHLNDWQQDRQEDPCWDIRVADVIALAALVSELDPDAGLMLLKQHILPYTEDYETENVLLENWLLCDVNETPYTDPNRLLDQIPLYGQTLSGDGQTLSSDKKNPKFRGTMTQTQIRSTAEICGTILRRNPLREQRKNNIAAVCILRMLGETGLYRAEAEEACKNSLTGKLLSQLMPLRQFMYCRQHGKQLMQPNHSPLEILFSDDFCKVYMEFLASPYFNIGVHDPEAVLTWISDYLNGNIP